MRKILVEITLNDEWDEYFNENNPICDELIINDMFDEHTIKDGIMDIKMINRNYNE